MSWQIKRTIKTTREFITEVGIVLAEVILELHDSFTLERRLVIYLAETFVKSCLFLISRVAYDLSVRRGRWDFISALSRIYYAYMSVLIVVCYTAVFSVCVARRHKKGCAEESYLSFVLNYKGKLYTEIFLNRLILGRRYLKRTCNLPKWHDKKKFKDFNVTELY